MKSIATVSLVLATIIASTYCDCNGCLSLDEYNFDKVINRFEIVFVKFDVAYPYGDKHNAFTKLADELATHKEIVVAQVGVKDYGEKENEKLAQRYGVKTKDEYPQVQLFVDGKSTATFAKDADWTVDNLRNVIRDNAAVYIGLPGCIESFDKLANEFVVDPTHEADRLKAAQELLAKSPNDEEKTTGKMYVLYMQKIIEHGGKFVDQEVARLGKILKDAKINKQKKDEMNLRLNVLHSFKPAYVSTASTKLEL